MSIIDKTRKGTDMDEFEIKSKVYIQTDAQGRVLRCEGGYTMGNIDDLSRWTFIDEGTGDRYNLCQSHYFEGGLYTEDGICRWVYDAGACRLRTEAEIQADRDALPPPPPTREEIMAAQIAALEDAMCEADAANAAWQATVEDALCELSAESEG